MCHRSIFTCKNSSKKNIEDKIKRNVCNHPTPKVHIYLQKHLKKDENIKRNACNHPTPKVHICLQKQLKIDENIKINPCNHPTLKVLIHLQKQLKVDDKIKINPCKHLTSKVLIYYIYIYYIYMYNLIQILNAINFGNPESWSHEVFIQHWTWISLALPVVANLPLKERNLSRDHFVDHTQHLGLTGWWRSSSMNQPGIRWCA